jgi:DnaJ like chaperone protein
MWGKVLGALFGMAMFKWFGLIPGLLIGHWFDRSMREQFEKQGGFAGLQKDRGDAPGLFMYSTFAVMGHLAKADGVVTPAHIDKAVAFMAQLGLNATQQKEAQQAFREGKAADFPLTNQLKQLYSVFRWRPDMLQLFLEIQISVAFVDDQLSNTELRLLRQVASALSVSEFRLQALIGRFEAEARFARRPASQQPAQDAIAAAYQLLGVAADCSDHVLKKAYKKLMAQHHPDKLVSQGLPPEMLEVAKTKTQQIQAAYELLRQHRG